jgi:predicted phosphodiesterase
MIKTTEQIAKIKVFGRSLNFGKLFNNCRKILIALTVLIVFLFLIDKFSEMPVRSGPFNLSIHFGWGSPGVTRLKIPPLGEIKAFTHHLPVVLTVSLDQIDLPVLQGELAGIKNADAYLKAFLPKLQLLLYLFMGKLLLLAGIAGGVAAWLLGWKNIKRIFLAAGVGILAMSMIIGGIFLDYNRNAFQNPRYEGALEAAPWALNLIERGLVYLPELRAKLVHMGENLNRLAAGVDSLEPLGTAEGGIKVLHVSDIHNHPAALNFIQRVIGGFKVDLVIDTGDLTDYGTELETGISSGIKTLGVKYLFIPGNHDSPEVVKTLRRFANVNVLRQKMVDFRDLKILGWQDPAASGNMITVEEQIFQAGTDKFSDYFHQLKEVPDILAVHNREMAKTLIGHVPLILSGHTHRPSIMIEQGTVCVNAGTTGAAGLRGLENPSLQYSLVLLHFKREIREGESKLVLEAADLIRIDSLNGKLILERRMIPNTEAPLIKNQSE